MKWYIGWGPEISQPQKPRVHHPPGTWVYFCLPAQKLSKFCPFGCLWRLHYIGVTDDIIGHWWLSPLACVPSQEVKRWYWKFQPFNHLVGSPGNQPSSCGYLGAFQNSPISYKLRCGWNRLVINDKKQSFLCSRAQNEKDALELLLLRNYKGFKGYCQELRTNLLYHNRPTSY